MCPPCSCDMLPKAMTAEAVHACCVPLKYCQRSEPALPLPLSTDLSHSACSSILHHHVPGLQLDDTLKH